MSAHVPAQAANRTPCSLAFLGEAPGEEEIDRGIPLVGPSGQIFDAGLRTAGIDRRECWVGNVYDVKAPGNDVTAWVWNAAFTGPHMARLERELQAARPTVIVPMGATALWALIGTTAITQMRGAVQRATRLVPGAKIVPSFHPAFVMRDWKFLPTMVGDFIRAKEEAALGPLVVYPKRALLLAPTMEEIEAYLPRLFSSSLLSVDIETGWGQITCIGFAPDEENAICIPFVDLRVPNRSYWETAEEEVAVWSLVRRVLESPVPKIGQSFGIYDAYWLLAKKGIRTMNARHDTRLLHHALSPELPKDLAFLGAAYSTQGPWKHWGHRKSEKKED